MENRAKDLVGEAKSMGRDAKDAVQETANQWADKAKSAGATAVQASKDAYGVAQSRVVSGARATDQTIRENPYATLGIAFGVGILLGFLIKRK